eukprot:8736506-Alexandrium_andersonii.AAC.1
MLKQTADERIARWRERMQCPKLKSRLYDFIRGGKGSVSCIALRVQGDTGTEESTHTGGDALVALREHYVAHFGDC